jgi:hypothetical protein
VTAWSCASTVVLKKCRVALHMHGELRLLFGNIRYSVYYEGDTGRHGSGFCQKLSAKVWAWMGKKRDHLVYFSTAGRVLTFILLGWVTFYYQQLMPIFCIKGDMKHESGVYSDKTVGGYCSFGASFLKFIFQQKKIKL